MLIEKNIILDGPNDKPIVTDVFYSKNKKPKPIVIFCHGYKGFKDWGAWDLAAKKFAENGFFFVKFNFSHNGGTAENPIDFPDLNAFAEDNFSKQLADLDYVINWVASSKKYAQEADASDINLMGHSRGGGIVLIKAAEYKKIKKVITLAGVSDFATRFPKGEALKTWEKEGVRYVENSRTKQKLPHNFQFYKDFKANKERFDIKRVVKDLSIPLLIIHAKDDKTVKLNEAKQLQKWASRNEVFFSPQGGHTFGIKHPWPHDKLSESLIKSIDKTMTFIKEK